MGGHVPNTCQRRKRVFYHISVHHKKGLKGLKHFYKIITLWGATCRTRAKDAKGFLTIPTPTTKSAHQKGSSIFTKLYYYLFIYCKCTVYVRCFTYALPIASFIIKVIKFELKLALSPLFSQIFFSAKPVYLWFHCCFLFVRLCPPFFSSRNGLHYTF